MKQRSTNNVAWLAVRPAAWSRPESAFTLLEVILAMSLSIVLLGALYTALSMHLRFAQQAPEQVQRAQLARAILDRIARDVRAVVPPPPSDPFSTSGSSAISEAPEASGAGESGSTDPAGSNSSDTEGVSSEPPSITYGLIGGTDWMQMVITTLRPNLDDTEWAASSGMVAQTSNVLQVRYSLTYLATAPDQRGATQRVALARSEVAAVAAEQFDLSGDDSSYRAATDILCDDLADVQFQYWDDQTASWLDSWGSTTPSAPPRAVRVMISLMPMEEYLDSQLGLSGTQSTWSPNYQIVIPISAWAPPESDTSIGMEASVTGG